MRNLNKIKELKGNKTYSFSLDNKQVASIVIGSLLLGTILFFTGFFIGNKKNDLNILNSKVKKNIAIIIDSNTKQLDKKDLNQYIENKKDVKKDISNKVIKKENTGIVKGDFTEKDTKKISKKEDVKEDIQKDIKKDSKEISKKEDIKEIKKIEKEVMKKDISNNNIKKENFNLPDIVNREKKTFVGSGDESFKTSLKSSKKGRFVLQVKATTESDDAIKLKEELKASGYRVFIEQVNSNGTLYNRVRIGYFKNKTIALKFKDDFEKESGLEKTFITKATK